MIVVLKPGSGDKEVSKIEEFVSKRGLKTYVWKGTQRVVVGIVGDLEYFSSEQVDPWGVWRAS